MTCRHCGYTLRAHGFAGDEAACNRYEPEHFHEWETGAFGVIIGVSRCVKCHKISRREDFVTPPHM